MDSITFLILVVSIILVVGCGIEAIPMIIYAIKPDIVHVSFDNSSDNQALLSNSAMLQRWLLALKELGFVILGVKVEKAPLWGGTFREIALISNQDEAYASIVLHPTGAPASLYFYTPLWDSGMVFTRNFVGSEAEGERLSVKNVITQDFRVILEDHRRRLQAFRRRGLAPTVSFSQQARLEATTAYYRSEYAHRFGPSLRTPAIRRFTASLLLLLAVVCWNIVQSIIG